MVTHVDSWFELGFLSRATDVSKVRVPNGTQPLTRLLLIRLCLPEGYNVRNIIYSTMKSHASTLRGFSSSSLPGLSASHIDGHHSMSRVAAELQKLIQIFDDILLEGYSNNHDTLSLPANVGRNPTCHYCGASLFLSYFDCAGTCLDLGADFLHVNMSIRVCGPCYVEGRFCECREMAPKRLRDFSILLRERNDIAITLSDYLTSCPESTGGLGEISER